MMKNPFFGPGPGLLFFISSLLMVNVTFSQVTKAAPPRWKKGYLDIHQISTGMGNACFIQFPDGTNLLIDAGAVNRDHQRKYSIHPAFDSVGSAGSYIAAYITKCIPNKLPIQLDNVIITHFHDDHTGYPDSRSSWSESGTYRLSGITELGSVIPIKLLLDNKWPDYEKTDPVNERIIHNYRRFIAEQQKKEHFRIDSFRLGSLTEVLDFRSNQNKYKVDINGIAVNGKYLKSDGTIASFFTNDRAVNTIIAENNLSCALTIRYGRFSFFTGGDIDNQIYDAAKSMGFADEIVRHVGKLSILVAGHHAMKGSISSSMVESANPDYLIIPAWSYGHPDIELLLSIRKDHPDVKLITTQLHPQTRIELQHAGMAGDVGTGGHIMIRMKRKAKRPRVFFIRP